MDYKQKCIEEFSLKPCLVAQPKEDPTTEGISASNEIWKRYYEFRIQQKRREAEQEKAVDGGEDYEYLRKELKEQLQEELDSIENRDAAQDLMRSTIIFVLDCTLEDEDDVRTSSYKACMFSPYQIPHAVEFTHRYHKRARYWSLEYSTWWAFRLVRFDGEGPADKIQQQLSRYFPKDIMFEDPLYDTETGEEFLCSNGCAEMPNEKARWVYCERPEANNLTPTTITRIREWLYGTPFYQSKDLISDFDLMRLVFASMGSPDFDILLGDIGHTWRIDRDHPATAYLKKEGHLADEADDETTVSWLEYAVRLATQSLRPIDMYYEPYDDKVPKSQWGSDVLEEYEERRIGASEDEAVGMCYGENPEQDEALKECSWLVWDRELKSPKMMDSSAMEGILRLLQR